MDNEITLTAFRMLVSDLLAFFHVVNEGVINVLGMTFTFLNFDMRTNSNVSNRALF